MAEHQDPTDGLSPFIKRNMEILRRRHAREQLEIGVQERIAEAITRFSGSMTFVYIHIVLVMGWVAWNLQLVPFLHPFDPTLVILATAASVEAIFLSTLVLITQNRSAAQSSRRDELELHMTLLAEHEITRILPIILAIAKQLNVETKTDPELEELQKTVEPETILDHIEIDESAKNDSRT